MITERLHLDADSVGAELAGDDGYLLQYFVEHVPTVDRSPYKRDRYLRGTHVSIHAPERIDEVKPHWDEILEQRSYVRKWGVQFIAPVPEATVL